MKILVVDDSKAMRMIVIRTLRQAGFEQVEITEAASGREGLDAVAAGAPDLILSDWNMPELNGIEFLRELRAAGNNTSFGFVTSEGSEDMRATAAEAGADFLVAKPFSLDTFRDAINTVYVA
jgi:two-component system chemotaxis response regulator CheY